MATKTLSNEFMQNIATEEAWKELSSEFNWSESMLEKYQDKVDWDEIAENRKMRWTIPMIQKFQKKINWNKFSDYADEDILTEGIIEAFKDKWNWHNLSRNGNLPLTDDLLEKYADRWDWEEIIDCYYISLFDKRAIELYERFKDYIPVSKLQNTNLWRKIVEQRAKQLIELCRIENNQNANNSLILISMVNLKATVRVKTKSGLYPVYIRFTKSNQVSYVKTSWVVNEKGLKNKKEITDPFVLHQTSMLIDGYYSQLNLIDTSKWTKSHYKGGMGEYERLKKALAIHEKAAACSASWGLFQIMGFNYAACGCKNAIEAPFIFKHGGYYYLFVSWDYCCRGKKSNYRVAVGRSKNVAGPYLDKAGKDMLNGGGTVVMEGDKKNWEAAGHCAAYTFDGQDIFICHGYSATRNGAAFLIQRPITWTPDGWPVIKL